LDVDLEVMQYERELPGWKIALNTTEFFYAPKLAAIEATITGAGALGAWCPAYIMVDPSPDVEASHDLPLIRQKPFGISLRGMDLSPVYQRLNLSRYNPLTRDRLYHQASFGAYTPGRHHSHLPRQCGLRGGAYILWFAHSPWTPALRQRKKQVKTRIPETDRAAGFGFHHFVNEDDMDRIWRELAPLAEDITPRLF
jgi:hypothetical protein